MPLRGVGVTRNQRLEVGEKVSFRARIAHATFGQASGRHIETGNQGLGPMPGIFKLLPLALTRSHRVVGRTSFQGLNAGHLINGDGAFAALCPLYCT